MRHIGAYDLHMQKKVIRQRTRNTPPGHIDTTILVGQQMAASVECLGIHLRKALLDILHHCIREAVQNMGFRRIAGPLVMLIDGAANLVFQLFSQLLLILGKTLESHFLDKTGDRRSRDIRFFRQCGNRTQTRYRIVLHHLIGQLPFGACQTVKLGLQTLCDTLWFHLLQPPFCKYTFMCQKVEEVSS